MNFLHARQYAPSTGRTKEIPVNRIHEFEQDQLLYWLQGNKVQVVTYFEANATFDMAGKCH